MAAWIHPTVRQSPTSRKHTYRPCNGPSLFLREVITVPFKIGITTLVFALWVTPALAQDYVINVNGIVCEFCSLGVAKKVSKLPFIDRSKYNDGVAVDISNQNVTIAVKGDAQLDQDQLFAAIEAGGYNPVTIWRVSDGGERVALQP